MKKKIIIALSMMLVFGLVAVVYAYNRTETTNKAAHSCPMKSETASSHTEKDSCCGMADCCKDGKCKMDGACCGSHDSCPMKDKQKTEKQSDVYSKITVSDDSGENCCGSGASCCTGGGACCKGKHG